MKTVVLSTIAVFSILTSPGALASYAYCFGKNTKSFAAVENISNFKGVAFVRITRDSGYYIISPQSSAINILGLQHAPYIDSDNNSRNGVGMDSIAFHFDSNGRLEGFPMYISQLAPDSFYTARLQGFSSGHSTLKLVRELFVDHVIHIEKRDSQTLAYLEVPVYNPLASGS